MSGKKLQERDSDLWQRVVNAYKEFSLALKELLSNKEGRIEIVRKGLTGQDREAAIFLLDYLRPEDIMQLFDELLYLASFSHGAILSVRKSILSLPRDWVINRIESKVEKLLVNGDYDGYRRFLELYIELDHSLALKLARKALEQDDEDIKEAGRDFLVRLGELQ